MSSSQGGEIDQDEFLKVHVGFLEKMKSLETVYVRQNRACRKHRNPFGLLGHLCAVFWQRAMEFNVQGFY